MRNRWLTYIGLGLCFGLVDWYFLALWARLSQTEALTQQLGQLSPLVQVFGVLLLIALNYGIWLVPVVPVAAYEMKRSGSIARAASAGIVVWSAAMVAYYGYYALMLMWVGLPNLDFMLFANRNEPGYWADWWPVFRRVIVDQFIEWLGIAVVGGAIVGAGTALLVGRIARRWQPKSRSLAA